MSLMKEDNEISEINFSRPGDDEIVVNLYQRKICQSLEGEDDNEEYPTLFKFMLSCMNCFKSRSLSKRFEMVQQREAGIISNNPINLSNKLNCDRETSELTLNLKR